MKRLLASLAVVIALPLVAAEGKWTPQQVLELDPKWLAGQGLELPASRLWDPERGTGLLAATINVGGCSAGWISADGLFITNHHCLFGLLQEHATPENDIITNGFLARSRDKELKSRTLRVTMPRRFTDVTAEIAAAVPKKADDVARNRAIKNKENELVARCEKQPNARCRVAAHDGGVQYVLQEMTEIADVRLVYAPPRAVGEYGGEIDNWSWPRHTGDFSIGRAYVDGKPFEPEFHFPIAKKGVEPDDFVMVLGYPGITYRSLTADEMEERRRNFGARATVYRDWIHILEESTKNDPAGAIAVADTVKSLANRQKNGEGQLAGFKRGSILEKQRADDEAVLEWSRRQDPKSPALAAHRELQALAKEKDAAFERDFLLDHIRVTGPGALGSGPRSLAIAAALAKAAVERSKPDAQRDDAFTARNIERMRGRLEREQKSLYLPADKALMIDFLARAAKLEPAQKIDALSGIPATADAVDALYSSSKIFDLGERMKMFGESVEQLKARRDPIVDLGLALQKSLDEYGARRERWDRTVARVRPVWRRAVIAHAGKPVAPDANSTLRVSFAHVKGYAPRDGVWFTPQTTLAGAIEKHTNEEPFDVPDTILAAAEAGKFGTWEDEKLGKK